MQNRWNVCFSKPKHYAMQYATTTCRTMLLCNLANICGINHSKYISYKYSNLHNMKFEYYGTQGFGYPIDVYCIDAWWGEGRLLLDLGSCRLWIPNGSLPCSPINWHALVMQNTTFVWLSINLMCNLSSKVFARKI